MDGSNARGWSWTDAWVLAALPQDGRAIDLEQLLAVMDAINHAVPTAAELSSSLGALIGAGLVESDGVGFRHSPDGVAVTGALTGSPLEWLDQLAPLLSAQPRPGTVWPISQEEVGIAYRRYMSR